MFDPSLKTYAVSLHFPHDVSSIITSAVSSIADATGNHHIIENKIPPHITIGAFHASPAEEAKLLQLVEAFAENQKPGIVHFTEIEHFKGKVLFLKPEKDDFLSILNAELHAILLPLFEKAENGFYLPEIWFPHTSLATRLNPNQFEKAKEIASQITLPLTAEIHEIGFYQCSPFLELKKIRLGGWDEGK